MWTNPADTNTVLKVRCPGINPSSCLQPFQTQAPPPPRKLATDSLGRACFPPSRNSMSNPLSLELSARRVPSQTHTPDTSAMCPHCSNGKCAFLHCTTAIAINPKCSATLTPQPETSYSEPQQPATRPVNPVRHTRKGGGEGGMLTSTRVGGARAAIVRRRMRIAVIERMRICLALPVSTPTTLRGSQDVRTMAERPSTMCQRITKHTTTRTIQGLPLSPENIKSSQTQPATIKEPCHSI
mmetsp:Transcript_62/g.177  ORF Transcript_62/g.177 Transcript_62/m.177 type:complete len:240 (-) Transcript_62:314-1033(-)